MRIFITGATGVLGRRLVDRFTDCGRAVVGLVRDEGGEHAVTERGGIPRYGDVLDRGTLDTAIDKDVDVAIHAATAIPESTKPSEAEWAHNDRVRKEGARNLLAVVPDGMRQLLFPSVVWIARRPDGSPFDETADRHPDRATQSAADVEELLIDRASGSAFDVAILRCGFLYAPDARDTLTWARQLIDGDLPIVGGGLFGRQDAELSVVHADDAAAAFVAAVEREASGIYHIVDDERVPAATLFTTFAERLDAPAPSRIPGWLARFFVGKIHVRGMTTPMPTTNEKARQELGWEPTYPSYREGIDAVVDSWATDGTLAELRGATATESADTAVTTDEASGMSE